MRDSQASRVKQYVQTLNRKDRYIVMLYYADGLTPIEISRVLDLPSTRVNGRLQELRQALNDVAQPRTATPNPIVESPAAYA